MKKPSQSHQELLDENVRLKKNLQKDDLGTLRLGEIVDSDALQSMMEDFYKLTHLTCGLMDMSGKLLFSVGWQDICSKFHRCHPDTLKNCIESDTILSKEVPVGEFKAYRCKNNMWDMVTPIELNGRHIGNIFLGQFFYEDETPDYELFRQQARQYGFDEEQYMAALDRVPRLSRETINTAMTFCSKLAGMISSLGYNTISLDRERSRQEEVLHKLSDSERKLQQAQYIAGMGNFTWDIDTGAVTWSDGMHKLLQYDKNEIADYEIINSAVLHPDDLERITKWLQDGIASGKEFLTPNEYRLIRKDGQIIHVQTNGQIEYEDGKAVRLFGTCLDITERKRAEATMIEQMDELRRWRDAMVGREERVIEVKKEVNDLLARLGEPPHYLSATEEDGEKKTGDTEQ